MVGADEPLAVRERYFHPVAESRLGPEAKKPGHCLESETTQRQINPRCFQKFEFFPEKGSAVVSLPGGRPVSRRGTPDGSRDPNVSKFQTILPANAFRPACPTGLPQGPIKPAPRLIPRKHPSGPVGAVCSRGQSDHHDSRIWIPPTRHRLPPIRLVPIGGFFFLRHLFPPADQSGTSSASDDFLLETFEGHPWERGEVWQEVRPIQREIWCRFRATIA